MPNWKKSDLNVLNNYFSLRVEQSHCSSKNQQEIGLHPGNGDLKISGAVRMDCKFGRGGNGTELTLIFESIQANDLFVM